MKSVRQLLTPWVCSFFMLAGLTSCGPLDGEVVLPQPAVNAPTPAPDGLQEPTASPTPGLSPTLISSPTPVIEPTSTPTVVPSISNSTPVSLDRSAQVQAIPYSPPFALQGSIAYRIEGRRLIAFELIDPLYPLTLWESEPLGEQVRGIGLIEDGLLIWADDRLQLWDLAQPAEPQLVSTADVGGPVMEVLLDGESGRIVIVWSRVGALEIITLTLTSANRLEELGRAVLEWPVTHRSPYVIDGVYFVVAGAEGLEIYRVLDVERLSLVTAVPLDNAIVTALARQGNHLIASTDVGLRVFDVSDWTAPRELPRVENLPVGALHLYGEGVLVFSQICGWHLNAADEPVGGCNYTLQRFVWTETNELLPQGVMRLRLDTNQIVFDKTILLGGLLFLEQELPGSGSENPIPQPRVYVLDLSSIFD